jgi:hypothetical protein
MQPKMRDKICDREKLTLLKRGSSKGLAFGVAMTLRFGDDSESGFRVFKWQWSSRL